MELNIHLTRQVAQFQKTGCSQPRTGSETEGHHSVRWLCCLYSVDKFCFSFLYTCMVYIFLKVNLCHRWAIICPYKLMASRTPLACFFLVVFGRWAHSNFCDSIISCMTWFGCHLSVLFHNGIMVPIALLTELSGLCFNASMGRTL